MLTLYEYLFLFAIYSFVGWALEVMLCSVDSGQFVNRGFLNGPICPIYGFGMIGIIIVLQPLNSNIFTLFAGSMLLCSILELVTGWAMKKLFHTTWWDYSDKPYNLGGYICLEMSIVWGVGGVVMINLVHPFILSQINLINHRIGTVMLGAFYILFVLDVVAAVLTVNGLNHDMADLNLLAQRLHEESERLAQRLGNAAIREDRHLEELRAEYLQKIEQFKARGSSVTRFSRRRLFKAFPRMHHMTLNEYLEEIKKHYTVK